MAYSLMYGFADIELVFDWGMGALALGAALLCSVGATWFSVRRELGVAPAELLRPAAPKAGKRILLERIRPLWRRLSFMHKLTVRNIFRYKKRLVMMIIGIGGCTALLVTGLGIRDSISDVVNYQFDEITLYDVSVTFIDVQDEAAQEAFRAAAGEDAQSLFVHESTVDASAGGTHQVGLPRCHTGGKPGRLYRHAHGRRTRRYARRGRGGDFAGTGRNPGRAGGRYDYRARQRHESGAAYHFRRV